MGMWHKVIEAGGKFVDEATAMFSDGTILKLSEFTAVRLGFLENTLEVFIYCLGL